MLTRSARTIFAASFLPLCLTALAHDHAHNHDGSKGLEFHENKGQWPQQVLFRARTPGGVLFVERNAFTYVVSAGGEHLMHGRANAVAEPLRIHAYKVHFEGATTQRHAGEERAAHYVNYFLGNDPGRWGSGAASFGAVHLYDVYPGIDMHVDGGSGMKYDWLVAAGADPSSIVMKYEGQDGLRVEGGLLIVSTSAGEVVEHRPVAWQEIGGVKHPVTAAYRLQNDRVFFDFPEGYDRRFPLVIDPVVTFSSYVGSSADNFGCTATYDASGHLYGAGSAFGFGYPTSVGAVQTAFGGGTIDMGVSKFSPDGTSLVWTTYVGGSDNDLPHSMVVNSDDELFILGTTGSFDFPVSANCYDATFAGGSAPPFGGSYGFTYFGGTDVAVVHLNATATALVGSTYVGGTGNDGLNQFTPLLRNYGDPFRGEIIMDDQERPVVVTSTTSSDLLTTAGASQASLAGGLDAYIFRMDPTLSTMLWATYHGGSANDAGYGVQVSSTGEVFATGGTQSVDLPVAGAPFASASSGGVDGFLARFAPDGTALLSATYFGTASFDQSYFVQLDTQDNVYVVGQTTGNYPVSAGVYANPSGSQFLQKFNNDLSASLWSTRIGTTGTENISPSAFLVSDCEQIYFSGWGGSVNPAGGGVTTSSTLGLPVTSDAFQSTTDGSDFYLMVLNEDAASLAYATFFGGTASEHVDGGTSRFDKGGRVYQAVCAGCGGTFPTTPGAWSSTDMGQNCNLGVFKIDFEQNVQVTIDANITATGACLTEPIVFNAVGTADNWAWDLGDGTLSTDATLAHIYDEPGTYSVMLIGTAVGLCLAIDTAYLEVNVVAPAVPDPIFEAVPGGTCDAVSVQFFNSSTGSSVYFWDFGDNTTSSQTNPVHAYAAPGTYTVTLALIDAICTDTAFLSVDVPVEVPGLILELTTPVPLCDGGSAILDAGAGFDTYLWSTNEDSETITVLEPGDYVVEVTDGFCSGTDTITVQAAPTYPSLADAELCPGEQELLQLPFDPAQVTWSDGSTGDSLFVSLAGTYWYTALDPIGCPITDTMVVSLAATTAGKPFIPNVFTPNGDEKNERFLPTNVDATDYSMDIYNRWGMRVYSTVNSEAGWNGKKDNNGETVPDGTYYVILTYSAYCDNKEPVTVTGHVTLLR
ncbi:MAG: gliding motility-associated C-terminal domain-containing protein [Flavobacteriales bacterium]|nr:gliding motility-associated C-terminal domain-containing protein [Flavobacteriales bacterium]